MITEAVLTAKGLGVLKSVGSKVLMSILSKQYLDSEPDLKQIVQKSVKDAGVDLKAEFSEIEFFAEDQLMTILDELSGEVIHPTVEGIPGIWQALSEKICQVSLLYHANESTKRVYSESFAAKFCIRLYGNLLASKKYAPFLLAKDIIAGSEFRESASGHFDSIEMKLDRVLAVVDKKELDGEKFVSPSLPTVNIGSENLDLSEKEDQELAGLFDELDALISNEASFEVQLNLSKKIVARVPPAHSALVSKAYNTILSCYLRASKNEYWLQGLEYDRKWSGHRNAYTKVIKAALSGNLQNHGEAIQTINSVSKTDILTFSDKHRNSYYMIAALIRHNSGDHESAKTLIEKCEDKQNDEYLHILFYIYSKDKNHNLLSKATEILSDDKVSVRVLQAVIYYLIDRFGDLQEELGNGLDALAQIKPYLELAYARAKNALEKNREKDSESLRSLITAFPCLSRLLSRFSDSLDLLLWALGNGNKHPFFLNNSAACFIALNMLSEAQKCFELMNLEEIVSSDGFDLYAVVLIRTKQRDKIQSLIPHLKLLGLPEIKKWKAIVTAATEVGGDIFRDITSEVREKFPEEWWAALAVAEYHIQIGENDTAIELLKAEKTRNPQSLMATARLAKLYAGIQKYDEAIECYEELLRPDTPMQEKKEYVNCLFHADYFGEVIELVDQYDPKSEDVDLQKSKAYACYELGHFKTAKTVLSYVYKSLSNDYWTTNNYASLCQKVGDIAELTNALVNAVRIKPNDYKSHLMLSQTYFDQQLYKDALVHARFALDTKFDCEDCHLNFMNIHRAASTAMPEDKYICSKENDNLHRDIISKFSERFPKSKRMRMVNLPQDDKGDLDIEGFKKMLEVQLAPQQNFLEMYKSHPLPVGALMSFLNRNVHEVWSYLVGSRDKDLGLFINRTSVEFLEKDVSRLDAAKTIVLDSLSLICLKHSNSLDSLLKLNKKIVIGSKTAQQFLQSLHSLSSSQEGHLSVGIENGQLIKEEISSERIQSVKGFVQEIIAFIKGHCEVIGDDGQISPKREIRKLLDESYLETWNIDGVDNSISVWADGNLVFLGNSVGKQVCSFQSLIMLMHRNGVISVEKYSEVIGDMVLAGYRGLYFNAGDSAQFLAVNQGDRGEFYLRRLFTGSYFDSMENRLIFLATCVAHLFSRNIVLPWLSKVISENYEAAKTPTHERLKFGIVLYSAVNQLGKGIGEADELITSLSILDTGEDVVTPERCKAFIESVLVRQKLMEIDKIRKSLGSK